MMRRFSLLLSACATAVLASACAAPTTEEEGDEWNEGALVTAAGGACPVDARLSQGFSASHDGVDLAAPIGTPIHAIMAGKVTASGPAQGYGQWIRIEHDDGSMTEYGHMSRRFVAVGARVVAGQKIANVGSEGHSTGPHLHLRTYASASKVGSGNGMNPVAYLRARGVAVPCKPSGGAVDTSTPPASADEGSDAPSTGTVSVWTAAHVRSRPALDATILATAPDGATLPAACWTRGDMVSAAGYAHDSWVKVEVNGKDGFISGIFLRGDETGGITTPCE